MKKLIEKLIADHYCLNKVQMKEDRIMPQGDGTGPWKEGPMTGRTAGYCAGYNMPGYDNKVSGINFRLDWGRGRNIGNGWGCNRRLKNSSGRFFNWMPRGRSYRAAFTEPRPETEKQFLQTRAQVLKSRLDEIKNRLDELTNANT